MRTAPHIKQTIAGNIASERERLRLSRRAFAELVGVDQMLVYKWERAQHRPNDENLMELARACGREFSWFYVNHAQAAA